MDHPTVIPENYDTDTDDGTDTDDYTAFQRAVGDAATAQDILTDLDGIEDGDDDAWELRLLLEEGDLWAVRAELTEMLAGDDDA